MGSTILEAYYCQERGQAFFLMIKKYNKPVIVLDVARSL